jgi:hypothetical protein
MKLFELIVMLCANNLCYEKHIDAGNSLSGSSCILEAPRLLEEVKDTVDKKYVVKSWKCSNNNRVR